MAERQPRCKEGRAWPLGNRGRARASLRDGPLQNRRDVTGWRARGKPPCARGPRAEHSPQLVHHPHQHEERVLADALLERVGEGGELLVCGARVKETAILTRRDRDTSGRAALASCHALRATGAGVRHCPRGQSRVVGRGRCRPQTALSHALSRLGHLSVGSTQFLPRGCLAGPQQRTVVTSRRLSPGLGRCRAQRCLLHSGHEFPCLPRA